MSAQENGALGSHIYELFNAGDLEQALEEGTDDVEVTLVPFGHQDVPAVLRQMRFVP